MYQIHGAVKPQACVTTEAGTTPPSIQLMLAAMVPQGSPPGTGMSPVATQGTPPPVWGSLGTPLWGQKPLPPGSCCGVCPTSGLSGINLLDEAFAS